MFANTRAKIKKHALSITLTIGALLAVGVGATYFFPVQVSAVLSAVGGFFARIGNGIAALFNRGSQEVAEIEPVIDTTPAPAAA